MVLRKKGIATAAKKATRVTSEGSVASYIHAGGKIGVLVEVNCESDFVARTDDFKELVKDIAMHIAASGPEVCPQGRCDAAAFDREKEIYRSQAAATGKPAPWWRRSWKARWPSSTRKSACDQPFIKEQTISVSAHRHESRQAGREHFRAPLRTLQSRRRGRDHRYHQAGAERKQNRLSQFERRGG